MKRLFIVYLRSRIWSGRLFTSTIGLISCILLIPKSRIRFPLFENYIPASKIEPQFLLYCRVLLLFKEYPQNQEEIFWVLQKNFWTENLFFNREFLKSLVVWMSPIWYSLNYSSTYVFYILKLAFQNSCYCEKSTQLWHMEYLYNSGLSSSNFVLTL